MESREIEKRFAIPMKVARQLISSDSGQRLAGLRRLQEDIVVLEQVWGFSALLEVLEDQPWEPGREQVVEPLRVIASIRTYLQSLRGDPNKNIRRRAAELCDLIETWEKIERGEIEPPFLTRLFVPIRVSSLAGLALVRRRSWFLRVWMRFLGG